MALVSLDDILDNLSTNSVEELVRKKFKEDLNNFYYITGTNTDKLQKGNYIKYVNLDIDDIKSGLLVDIIYEPYGYSIKFLLLKNTYINKLWKVSFNKYHIFQTDKSADFFRQVLADIKNNKELSKTILRERLNKKKYKK